jgi:hypothetical protein
VKLASLGAALLLVAAGCAEVTSRPSSLGDEPQRCEALYRDVDRAVERAEVRDGGTARIEGFPYLRSDRLLASFAPEAADGAPFDDWVLRLRALGRAARHAELANLPASEHARLNELSGSSATLEEALDHCARMLAGRDFSARERRDALRAAARVPDDYSTSMRIVGLYWLARIPFASGVQDYQRETQATFDAPLEALPLRGTLVAYAPPEPPPLSREAAQEAALSIPRDALGIPAPAQQQLETLFAAHAPVWLVDQYDDHDRIGRLVLREDGKGTTAVAVDVSAPTTYRRAAHTRYGNHVLLQLVYSVWFPGRPKPSTFDLLGGHLDALVWRVTLSPGGEPLVFDSIHSCGCYHQFFPTSRARLRPQPRTLDEWAFAPQEVTARAGDRIGLRVQSGTHYLERVVVPVSARAAAHYAVTADEALRSVPHPAGGRRSVFRPDGIVEGSQRGERYLFWPMGIREPGAMRQWGRHATAFIGRRHCDEARLMERYFELQLE